MHPTSDLPHRRCNASSGDWVLVSPHRNTRPWQGRQEGTGPDAHPAHDPARLLCAGNTRSNGQRKPAYTGTCVFDDDLPVFLPKIGLLSSCDKLFARGPAAGTCRVLRFSPRHDWTLPAMPRAATTCGAPFAEGDQAHWQLPAHFFPPLPRSVTAKKFVVGYETPAGAQRGLTPEQAADTLRRQPEVHFRR